ncbi:hypothetical protein Poli38472_005800 [Pythium oligandrum]|uniref:Nucleolar 27S pre-rRNA processing Urb2/Npa2 C-terminal domain-containing protein n=1 Tax=Pythium oligandrum TaxID=41045 RepID=A0A8K1CR83_PYTOL|nr:hypothetical protein Poli38472_005800 [Pythium oligandrum]|eukprot:TMW68332.1 hypothetical protein Poli38472_005800 [Pythium oligandrum]
MTTMDASWDATLTLLRWKQTRRGYDGDDALLLTAFALLESVERLQEAERAFNIPTERIVTELVHFALMLITKPRRDDNGSQSRSVLRLLHLGLKALASTASLAIPMNACNLLLSAMADTLESVKGDDDDAAQRAVVDVQQIFVFLFGIQLAQQGELSTPSFHMYKPPTNVYTTFMQRACPAVFALLETTALQQETVSLLHAILLVFQELQHTQLNKKKVFLAVAKTSFRDLVAYRHALSQHEAVPGIAYLRDVLDRIVVDALFDSEHLREYEGAMVNLRYWQNGSGPTHNEDSEPKHKKQRRKHGGQDAAGNTSLVSYQRNLFDELKALLADASVAQDVRVSAGALMGVLVQGFSVRIRAAAHEKIDDAKGQLKTSKKRVANVIATTSTTYSPFKFWAELCAVAMCAFDDQQTNEDALALLVAVYDALFLALCDADVYRVTEDTEEQEQFHMMETILARLLDLVGSMEPGQAPTLREQTSSVIANAVRCTPNLVNSSLRSILHVLGASSSVPVAASACMVDMLHAYESMRLLDSFLRVCCSTDDSSAAISKGLYVVFTAPTTDATLRRTFMTLPPGQLEIVWRLLVDNIAVLLGKPSSDANAAKMSLVRLVLGIFLQEIHITPQNRNKISELVTETHEKLTVTLISKVSRKKLDFTTVERELFSVFGEFLALYDGLVPAVRAKTLDEVLTAMQSKAKTVMTSLLEADDAQSVGAAAGIMKIGVHWLRRDTDKTEGVAPLLVHRAMAWTCWDAVAFYLPELVEHVEARDALALYVKILESSLTGEAGVAEAAGRLLRDAAFYEIESLRAVAAQAFNSILSTKNLENAVIERFFTFLLTVPSGYLAPEASSELLTTILKLHATVDVETTLALVGKWLEGHARGIAALSLTKKTPAALVYWFKFVLLKAASDEKAVSLVPVVIQLCFVDAPDSSDARAVLDKILLNDLLSQKTPRGYSTCARVLTALAETSKPQSSAFADKFVALIESTSSILGRFETATSFNVLTSLVQYAVVLPDSSKLRGLLQTHLSAALAVAMQQLVGDAAADNTSPALRFFHAFCDVYHLLRPSVTLETYGCLLAVAMVQASRVENASDDPSSSLMRLVAHANKDEFRLVVSTVLTELRAPSSKRVIPALQTLVCILETDKKLSTTRRQMLGEHKTPLIERLIALLSRSLYHNDEDASSSTTLCVWTLRVFVLVYCKAELFTWRSSELLQVFAGFQPLSSLATDATRLPWSFQQIHQLWLLSYTLLLRIVRHHFLSLINALPQIIDALNALLRVLVSQSSSTTVDAIRTACTLEWAANLARLYGYLKPQDAAVRKHVVYVLLAYLRGVTQGQLSLALQHKLRPGIFVLLEICSLYEKEQLFASLDATGKSLLKSLDASFKLTHRYAGKV